MFLAMVDKEHREFSVQSDFFGSKIPTIKYKTIDLILIEVYGEEGIF